MMPFTMKGSSSWWQLHNRPPDPPYSGPMTRRSPGIPAWAFIMSYILAITAYIFGSMITINVKKIQEKKESEIARIRATFTRTVKVSTPPPPPLPQVTQDSPVLKDLESRFRELKIQRNKLSSTIASQLCSGATQEQLKNLYDEIESFRPEMMKIYDQIAYVKRHGQLPSEPQAEITPSQESDLYALKYRAKMLQNQRYKYKKKLAPSAKPPTQASIQKWSQKLQMIEAEYEQIRQQIQQINGE